MGLLSLDLQNKAHVLVDELVSKTFIEKPKQDDVRALRSLLVQHPEILKEGQDLVSYATEICANQFYKNTPALTEIVMLKIQGLKQDLGWQDSCPLERLLISSVSLNYLRWVIAGLVFDNKTNNNHSIDTGVYWQKQLDSANRQYLRSIEALTKFRKLARSTPSLRQDLVNEVVM